MSARWHRNGTAWHCFGGVSAGGGDIVANFSPDNQKLSVPMPSGGKWREFFSGDEAELDGTADVDVEHWAAKVFLKA